MRLLLALLLLCPPPSWAGGISRGKGVPVLVRLAAVSSFSGRIGEFLGKPTAEGLCGLRLLAGLPQAKDLLLERDRLAARALLPVAERLAASAREPATAAFPQPTLLSALAAGQARLGLAQGSGDLGAALGSIEALYGNLPRSIPNTDESSIVLPAPAAAAPKPALARPALGRRAAGLVEKVFPPLKTLREAPKEERRLVGLAFLWNMLSMAAFLAVIPARNALLLTKFDETILPWVYMGSAAATGVAAWLFSRFSHLPRPKVVGGAAAALAGTLLLWAAAATFAPKLAGLPFAFYLWTDVFGIMGITLFWTYANDVFRGEAAKKHFALIAAGSPLGAILGSLIPKLLIPHIGSVPMLWVALGAFLPVFGILWLMERLAGARAAAAVAVEKPTESVFNIIRSSPLLIFLTLTVLLERLVPDISNYIFTAAAREAYSTKDAIGAFTASFNLWVNTAAFAVSLLFTPWLVRVLGFSGALMSAALINLAGFGGYMFLPALAWVVGYNGAEGAARYTLFKFAKESTYSAAERDVIYRVKAWIEMFVYRFARGIAGFLLLGLAWLGGGLTAAAWLGIPLAVLWAWSGWRLGREFQAMERLKNPPPERKTP